MIRRVPGNGLLQLMASQCPGGLMYDFLRAREPSSGGGRCPRVPRGGGLPSQKQTMICLSSGSWPIGGQAVVDLADSGSKWSPHLSETRLLACLVHLCFSVVPNFGRKPAHVLFICAVSLPLLCLCRHRFPCFIFVRFRFASCRPVAIACECSNTMGHVVLHRV